MPQNPVGPPGAVQRAVEERAAVRSPDRAPVGSGQGVLQEVAAPDVLEDDHVLERSGRVHREGRSRAVRTDRRRRHLDVLVPSGEDGDVEQLDPARAGCLPGPLVYGIIGLLGISAPVEEAVVQECRRGIRRRYPPGHLRHELRSQIRSAGQHGFGIGVLRHQVLDRRGILPVAEPVVTVGPVASRGGDHIWHDRCKRLTRKCTQQCHGNKHSDQSRPPGCPGAASRAPGRRVRESAGRGRSRCVIFGTSNRIP